MKKIVAAALLLAALYFVAGAVPAPRKPFRYTQPDGTVVTLVNHGDEFHNWTTMNGVPVREDEKGFYRPLSLSGPTQRSLQLRNQARRYQAAAQESSISIGEKSFLVILIEFSDLQFTVSDPTVAFTNLLNEEGYSRDGGTGSVRDFYIENSHGLFQPTYDVAGPVRLSKSYRYYGKQQGSESDLYPDEALYEACQLLDMTVDFSKYDHDGDGFVDNVFFYYAGHNQAEGGGADTIWPHAWALYRYPATFDGVRVWSYACASEYSGAAGRRMCSIGTFTHEFGHVLGLPDFYDTDYEENGYADDLGNFSTMCGGCYNNDGRTPPLFNIVERNMLGWAEMPEPAQKSETVTLHSVGENEAMLAQTSVRGEYFLYEMRDGTGWDAYLPVGMVAYHLDMSRNEVVPGVSALDLWRDSNSLNAYAVHPCFYVVPSYSLSSDEYAVFPGKAGITEFEPVDWSGSVSAVKLRNIALQDNTVVFDTEVRRVISGSVRTPLDYPLDAVSVVLTPASGGVVPASAPRYTTITGLEGKFMINIPVDEPATEFILRLHKDEYASYGEFVDITGFVSTEIVLQPLDSEQEGAEVLSALGFSTIALPSGELRAGDEMPLRVCTPAQSAPDSVQWFYDGGSVGSESLVLTSGTHTLRAVLVRGGASEELTVELQVR